MKTQYYTASSLDGFLATVDDSLEWLFPLGGYQRHHAAPGKNIWIVGGGDLAGQFYDAGLLDEVIVQVGSVKLGSGKPLLPRQILSPRLNLVSAQRIGPGFAELHYAVVYPQNSVQA